MTYFLCICFICFALLSISCLSISVYNLSHNFLMLSWYLIMWMCWVDVTFPHWWPQRYSPLWIDWRPSFPRVHSAHLILFSSFLAIGGLLLLRFVLCVPVPFLHCVIPFLFSFLPNYIYSSVHLRLSLAYGLPLFLNMRSLSNPSLVPCSFSVFYSLWLTTMLATKKGQIITFLWISFSSFFLLLEVFLGFLKAYVEKFSYKSITTDDWKNFLYVHFKDKVGFLKFSYFSCSIYICWLLG
jgi:hypothetical protein